jgi:hypothetical protein
MDNQCIGKPPKSEVKLPSVVPHGWLVEAIELLPPKNGGINLFLLYEGFMGLVPRKIEKDYYAQFCDSSH